MERDKGIDKRNEDFARVFSSPEGRRVLGLLVDNYCLLTPVPATDPNAAMVREAQKSVIAGILLHVQQGGGDSDYVTMIKESKDAYRVRTDTA